MGKFFLNHRANGASERLQANMPVRICIVISDEVPALRQWLNVFQNVHDKYYYYYYYYYY